MTFHLRRWLPRQPLILTLRLHVHQWILKAVKWILIYSVKEGRTGSTVIQYLFIYLFLNVRIKI